MLKKLRCHYGLNDAVQSKCVACSKSQADFVFNTLPDGVSRSAPYVVASPQSHHLVDCPRHAELDSNIRALEAERHCTDTTPSELDIAM